MTVDSPRTGPAVQWIQAADVLAWPNPENLNIDEGWAAQAATAASEILYMLSGRRFTGITSAVDRPVSRPTDADTRFGHGGAPSGYLSSGMAATAWGQSAGGSVSSYGMSKPPSVFLSGYPVVEVTLVKIDGLAIPSNEWYLQDRKELVRCLPTAGATPTARWGWPQSQRLDLPDTELATFSVAYNYGVAPPQSGVMAATFLAFQLCLDALGQDSSLPQRVTSVSRQGISVAVVDVMDFFSKGLTGIYFLDLFLEAVNPGKAKLPPMAWSPDRGRPRRMPAAGI
jgi:hypothetical protein